MNEELYWSFSFCSGIEVVFVFVVHKSILSIPLEFQTIQFSEDVTGFVVGDITVGNGTAGNFVAIDGDTYTADITPSADGAVTVGSTL